MTETKKTTARKPVEKKTTDTSDKLVIATLFNGFMARGMNSTSSLEQALFVKGQIDERT
jgi:hypothetical protein